MVGYLCVCTMATLAFRLPSGKTCVIIGSTPSMIAHARAVVEVALEMEEKAVIERIESLNPMPNNLDFIPTMFPIERLELCELCLFNENISLHVDDIPFDAPLFRKYPVHKCRGFKKPKIHNKLSRRLLRTKEK